MPSFVFVVALLICSMSVLPPAQAEAWPTGPTPPSGADLRAAVGGLDRAMPAGLAWRAPARLDALYSASGFEPLWTEPAAVDALRRAVSSAERDGLSRHRLLPDARRDPFDGGVALTAAERELRLSDTLFVLLDRLANGVADARGLSPAVGEPIPWRDVAAIDMPALVQRLRRSRIRALIDEARPDTPLYARLRGALHAELDAPPIASIGPGDTLQAGSAGERVTRLRARLLPEGDLLPVSAEDGARWDDGLRSAVVAFQSRNGLDADGKVGRRTLARLDLSRRTRIDALRINLERARWFARSTGDDDRVEVNIPDYRLRVHLDQQVVWQTSVIVGKRANRTPIFTSQLDTVVLDPTWTVPRSIVVASLYEEARADPAAFAAKGYRLRDEQRVMHDPTAIDWSTMTLDRFRYWVVQSPGPGNALGSVKFLFDNPYSVYLHDTPARHLFSETERTMSHGCIRVQHPHHLEALLLESRAGIDQRTIAALRRDRDNVSLALDEPITVALLYWTADVDERGRLRLLPDPYQRDAPILEALGEPDPGAPHSVRDPAGRA